MTDSYEIEVAVPVPLPRTFTYLFPQKIPPGSRVLIPFRSKQMIGIVVSAKQPPSLPAIKLKEIHQLIDKTPIFTPVMLKLAHWMSEYYFTSIGEVFRWMLPSSQQRSIKSGLKLTKEARNQGTEELAAVLPFFQEATTVSKTLIQKTIGKKALDALLARNLLVKASLRSTTWREMEERVDPLKISTKAPSQEGVILNVHQKEAVERIRMDLKAPPGDSLKPILLHGVTGSGKTEVFLHAIQQLFEGGLESQVLVLVPEISLTPQMTRQFRERFGERVSVVHSKITDPDRWAAYQKIWSQKSQILIGPRSAVFAPFQNLRLIIVDEEHDSSYKQQNSFPYSARDIAVVRAKLEKAVLVLASATPSLESFHNAQTGKYSYIRLPERIGGQVLPKVDFFAAAPPKARALLLSKEQGRLELSQVVRSTLHGDILQALKQNLADGHQSMVIVGRRAFSYYLLDAQTRAPVQCPKCAVSMAGHARRQALHCHYCGFQLSLPDFLKTQPPEKNFFALGSGSQRIEDELKAQIPQGRISRLDSDATAKGEDLQSVLGKFRGGEIDILLGTQIIAKGHDFPRVTLVVILEVDQLLTLPDFRGAEKSFQLMVQAAGRAGRGKEVGRVLIQTWYPHHPVVKAAMNQDYEEFAARELARRKLLGYPPFSRIIMLEWACADENMLIQEMRQMELLLEAVTQKQGHLLKTTRILGPAPPAIEKINGQYRRCLYVISSSLEHLRHLVWEVQKRVGTLNPSQMQFQITMDPQTVL